MNKKSEINVSMQISKIKNNDTCLGDRIYKDENSSKLYFLKNLPERKHIMFMWVLHTDIFIYMSTHMCTCVCTYTLLGVYTYTCCVNM